MPTFANHVKHVPIFLKYRLYDLERLYARCLCPLGVRQVQGLMRKGFPPQWRSPLEFLFTNQLRPADRAVVARIEILRATTAEQTQALMPVGANPGQVIDGYALAYRTSIPPAWGTFLYLCAKTYQARHILELGSGGGISGAYLASAPSCQAFITVEGSPERASVAESNVKQIGAHAKLERGMFHQVVPALMPQIEPIDVYYLDGSHNYDATIEWVTRVMPQLNASALVILDDIHWSEGMYRAWQTIVQSFGFAYTLDAGRVGLCHWSGIHSTTQSASLAHYLGWFRNH